MTSEAEHGTVQKALIIVLVFVGLAAGYACTFAGTSTTFILPLTKQFGWGRVVPSLMYVAAMFGVVIASFFLGRVVERLGEALVVALSGACLAVVMVLHSLLSGSPVVAVALSLLGGLLGAGTGVGLYVAILPKWFNRDLGRALGAAVIGQSAGAFLMPPISAGIIAARGWRTAYLALATIELLVTLMVAAALAWLGSARMRTHRGTPAIEHEGCTLSEAVRHRGFWLLEAAIFLQTLGVFGANFHLFPIYHDLGLGWMILPRVTIAAALGMALGRLISGFFLDIVEPRLVATGMFTIGFAATGWLATLTHASGLEIYLPPALLGVALGSETDILAYFARRLFGLRHYALIYNRLLMGYFLGTMAGPFLLGWAFDHLAGRQLGLWALASSCGVAAVVSLFLPPTRTTVREERSLRGSTNVPFGQPSFSE